MKDITDGICRALYWEGGPDTVEYRKTKKALRQLVKKAVLEATSLPSSFWKEEANRVAEKLVP